MGYTHYGKLSGESGLYVGTIGSEFQMFDSAGNLYGGNGRAGFAAIYSGMAVEGVTSAEVNIMDGVTCTTAELNALAGTAASAAEHNYRILVTQLADVSTASKAYVASPITGTVKSIYTCLGAAITSVNAAVTMTDCNGSAATAITVAYSGSAAGDVDTSSPASNNVLTAGKSFYIETDGASDGTAPLYVTILAEIT